jgi:hypothetical protein
MCVVAYDCSFSHAFTSSHANSSVKNNQLVQSKQVSGLLMPLGGAVRVVAISHQTAPSMSVSRILRRVWQQATKAESEFNRNGCKPQQQQLWTLAMAAASRLHLMDQTPE